MANSSGSFPGLLVSSVRCALLHLLPSTSKRSLLDLSKPETPFEPPAVAACVMYGLGGTSTSSPFNSTTEM